MGSTTTDLVAIRGGAVANLGYTDAERLASGELVYTGFTRSFPFAVARGAPVRGRLIPLMNEYFASMADVHRILGVLDEEDDRLPAADGKEKTVEASVARLARMRFAAAKSGRVDPRYYRVFKGEGEPPELAAVSRNVLIELLQPERQVALRRVCEPASRMPVPEAPVDKNDGAVSPEHHVWSSRQLPTMKPETESQPVQD